MALLEKHRNTIYNAFVPLVGEEAAQAMLSQFPARDVDEPASKEHLDLRLAELRTEMHQLFNRHLLAMITLVGVAVAVILGAG